MRFSLFSLNLSSELEVLKQTKSLTLVNLGNIPARAFIVNQIFKNAEFQNIFWASTDEKADQIAVTATSFFDGHIHVVSSDMTMAQFYTICQEMETKEKSLFIFEDLEKVLSQTFPSLKEIDAEKIVFQKGQKIDIFDVFDHLERHGYRPAENEYLVQGEFVRRGENLFVFPFNESVCFRIEFSDNEIENIGYFSQITDDFQEQKKCSNGKERDVLEVFPKVFEKKLNGSFFQLIHKKNNSLFISDDLDKSILPEGDYYKIKFTTFPEEEETFFHLNFFSVLPFYTILDFVVEIKERFRREFDIVIVTKRSEEIEKIFRENEIMFTNNIEEHLPSTVRLVKVPSDVFIPHSFQNNDRKILFLTDREIFKFQRSSQQKKAIAGMNIDLMTSLKPGNFVVHSDHGLAQFDGIVRRDLGKDYGVREYLKLCYAENDKLFVPVESAEKITKFIGDENPKLTRLGSNEWQQSKKKLKEEAQKIAKELLALYAKRELAKGKAFHEDDEMIHDFCESFPYELTPGQAQAWNEVKHDMEDPHPMDRLLCGDVGFGKTEIAMRAAFKCFRTKMQAVILAPITILAEQHYQSFMQRIEGKNYGVRIELLSRFQSKKEQKDILSDIEHGLVDIVIGTHRILSDDIKFKNLGLFIIDEEQRFGVGQKEKLKRMRASVDILTMTATPIPRTLNLGLNKLKDISTITTPPPGRLPVITEVRKYNLNLIRDRILLELKRGGQVYFLHNQVQTIEAQSTQLKALIPEARFIVAHGQLGAGDLEERIRSFKNKEADVLVASTIIENGIDLPDANTLIVNRAEKFGLSQLYQLRGRVGRRRTQAYAYFLYQGQKLELEAKKRLRAIVEASELGAGFQIAMRDMEIRGAGEVLGFNQSGAVKTVGVSHFVQLLNKTIEEMKSGEIRSDLEEKEENITVEIPLSAYIPVNFIANEHEKIQVYKELASTQDLHQLEENKCDLREDYGTLPQEVENLFKIIELKIYLRQANIEGVKVSRISHNKMEIVLRMGKKFTPDQVFDLVKESSRKWIITANALKLSVPQLPVNWYEELIEDIKMLTKEKK